jgi:hypothetical protein
MLTQFIGWLMGVENLQSIDSVRVSLAAPWAQNGPAWALFGCAAVAALAVVFYSRYQPSTRKKTLSLLAISRAVLLAMLLLILAEPVLKMDFTSRPRPLLWVLFDGTESMDIQDEMTESDRARLAEAVGITSGVATSEAPATDKQPDAAKSDAANGGPASAAPAVAVSPTARLSRMDYVKALVSKPKDNLIGRLEERFRVQAFILDRPDGVRELNRSNSPRDTIDAKRLAEQLTTKGQLTALGTGFNDLAEGHATSHLAGVVMFSDFGNNTGPAPAGTATSPVKKLGVPVYAVGVGPQVAVDLATEIEMPRQLKKAERQEVKVVLRQSGLDGRRAKISVTAKRKIGVGDPEPEVIQIGQREVQLAGPTVEERFDYVPQQTGEFQFLADVERMEGQVVDQGNHVQREATVIDDFLRLMYVEYEPTWEWRFIKEVFHRDPLVGMKGFRTFLRSSDPKVRTTNPLFLPSLTPKRSDFLANDVIFLGDMPATALGERFCDLASEFVTQFGGGLVIIGGPRFGPGQLESTKLADILPVVVDSSARMRDDHPFHMQLSLDALNYKFMQLGEGEQASDASRHAWDNMGMLPWYQPVKWKHPLATVLAEHPTDMTADGRSHQPLIAIREFPSGGKVVYIGFNETWRLRRKFGEQYYRQFWGQMIQHIGLSNHIGLEKRFVVKTDKLQYKPDDRVRLTVQAYDANFEPLTVEKLSDKNLTAEVLAPRRSEGAPVDSQTLNISQLSKGVFEIEFPVLASGGYRVRVKDPITGTPKEVSFRVVNLSPERQTAVRNVQLQEQIAAESQGKTYDLETASRIPDEINLKTFRETSTKVLALWSTWLCFGLGVLLMLGEWLTRKLINLP